MFQFHYRGRVRVNPGENNSLGNFPYPIRSSILPRKLYLTLHFLCQTSPESLIYSSLRICYYSLKRTDKERDTGPTAVGSRTEPGCEEILNPAWPTSTQTLFYKRCITCVARFCNGFTAVITVLHNEEF